MAIIEKKFKKQNGGMNDLEEILKKSQVYTEELEKDNMKFSKQIQDLEADKKALSTSFDQNLHRIEKLQYNIKIGYKENFKLIQRNEDLLKQQKASSEELALVKDDIEKLESQNEQI